MYLKDSSMNKWKGWHVLGGEFNEKMERLGCTCRKVYLENGKVGAYLKESSMKKWKGWVYLRVSSMGYWKVQ